MSHRGCVLQLQRKMFITFFPLLLLTTFVLWKGRYDIFLILSCCLFKCCWEMLNLWKPRWTPTSCKRNAWFHWWKWAITGQQLSFFFVKIKNTLIVFLVTEFVVMKNKTIGNDERSFWKLRCPEGSRNLWWPDTRTYPLYSWYFPTF